jgi:hypothetical protein
MEVRGSYKLLETPLNTPRNEDFIEENHQFLKK